MRPIRADIDAVTPPIRPLLVYVLLALGSAACAPGGAELVAAHEPRPAVPAAALEIAARAGATTVGGVPDLVGATTVAAQRTLADGGLHVRIVAFDDGDVVTAQYPEPGAPVAAGADVTLWVGEPPAPPPPPAEPASPPADDDRDDDDRASNEPVEQPASSPDPSEDETALAEASASQEGAGTLAPARTSPRAQPPAVTGRTLTGTASWYGPGFAGRTTACGGRFDPAKLTLATRELRCGTTVRVTATSGRSIEATVTDWGPAEWTGRRFDLSEATFAAIAPLGAGVTTVTVEVLS